MPPIPFNGPFWVVHTEKLECSLGAVHPIPAGEPFWALPRKSKLNYHWVMEPVCSYCYESAKGSHLP